MTQSLSSQFSNRSLSLWSPALFEQVWQVLRNPFLILATAGLLLLLGLFGLLLPQLPGQYVGEPAESARWLIAAQEQYGSLGPLLDSLGLFDIAHSLAVRLLLALFSLLLLVHAGDWLAELQRERRLSAVIDEEGPGGRGVAGLPLPLPGAGSVQHLRAVIDSPPADVESSLRDRLTGFFGAEDTWSRVQQVEVLAGHESEPGADAPAADPSDVTQGQSVTEARWLLSLNGSALYFKLVFGAGAILGLAFVWAAITYGWGVKTAVLAPGSQVRYPFHDLLLAYEVDDEPAGAGQEEQSGRVAVQLDNRSGSVAVEDGNSLRLGRAGIQLQVEQSALSVESWSTTESATEFATGAEQTLSLALSGRPVTDQLGFTFSSPGSEESLLLPDAGLGLRIVRLEGQSYQVEVVDSDDGQVVDRYEISPDGRRTIPIEGETDEGETDLDIRFHFLPGIQVQVRSLPLLWLAWIAIPLVLVGLYGFWRRYRFAVVQLCPWPGDRSALIVQSNWRDLIEEVREQFLSTDEEETNVEK